MSKPDNDTTWNSFLAQTWNRHRPPIRPSQVVIDFYAKTLDESITKNNMLETMVLGATPEIRDLILSKNLSPVVVDYSDVNYRTLALLMRQFSTRERFINQNWITMSLDRQFDLIIGDHSLNVISSESITAMLSNLHEHMKKQGLLVVRTWIRPTTQKPDLLGVIEEYRETLQSIYPFYPTCVGPIQTCFYDDKNNSMKLAEMSSRLRKLYEQKILTEKEWSSVEILDYDNVTLEVYIPLKQEFIDIVSKSFRVIDVFYPLEPFSKYCPIFVLEKN